MDVSFNFMAFQTSIAIHTFVGLNPYDRRLLPLIHRQPEYFTNCTLAGLQLTYDKRRSTTATNSGGNDFYLP